MARKGGVRRSPRANLISGRAKCPRCGYVARVSARGLILPHYYGMIRSCDGVGVPAPKVEKA